MTLRYVDSVGRDERDVDYHLSAISEGWTGSVMRIKGVVTNLWMSERGWLYLCVPSEQGILRYKDLDAPNLAATEEIFRLPFIPFAVWGLDEAHVYAWGAIRTQETSISYEIARFDGSTWQLMPSPPFELLAVHGSHPDCIYAVGHRGIARWDGHRWTEIPSPSRESLTCVFVVSETEVYIGGYGGSLLEGGSSGFGTVAVLGQGLPIFAVAKFLDEVYVGGGPLGLWKKQGPSGELAVVKADIKATQLEARADSLYIVDTDDVILTLNAEDYEGFDVNIDESVDPRDP